MNERFAKLAEEEKERNFDRDFRRRDDAADGGPPQPVVSSRFAAAIEDHRSYRDRNDNVASGAGDGGGPPLMPTNSRFAAAAADYETERATRDMERAERGAPPPMVANSRFAAAAADNEREREVRDRERSDRFGRPGDDRAGGGSDRFGRGDDRGGEERFGRNDGPPPMQNSRFAAAVQGDEDYVPAEVRNQRRMEREEQGQGRFGQQEGGGGRFGGDQDDGGDGRSRFGGGERGGGRYGDRDRGQGRYGRGGDDEVVDLPTGPRWKQEEEDRSTFPTTDKSSRVADILAPKKPREEVVLPPVEAPLTLPGEDEAAAKARIEKKKREAEEKAAAERKAAEDEAAKRAAADAEAAEKAAKAAALESKLLNEFISGNKLGEELQQWCADQGDLLPTVEKLIFHLLSENKDSPDPECSWASPEKYGTALLSLVEDKANEQMQVLWAIQKYCDSISFPKVDDEYLIQSMFRAMYKYDLTEPGAFDLWKDDESVENSQGKTKAVIQTMDWFAWLEEDDDDDEGDDDEEYEEE